MRRLMESQKVTNDSSNLNDSTKFVPKKSECQKLNEINTYIFIRIAVAVSTGCTVNSFYWIGFRRFHYVPVVNFGINSKCSGCFGFRRFHHVKVMRRLWKIKLNEKNSMNLNAGKFTYFRIQIVISAEFGPKRFCWIGFRRFLYVPIISSGFTRKRKRFFEIGFRPIVSSSFTPKRLQWIGFRHILFVTIMWHLSNNWRNEEKFYEILCR